MKIKEPIIKNATKQELFSTNENDYQDYLIETNSKTKIEISNCEINNCIFKDIDFSNIELINIDITNTIFENCDLSNKNFNFKRLNRVIFKNKRQF